MNRHFWLIRHAKSAWPPNVADMDRPLGDRGHSDGQTMSKIFATYPHKPQLWITSDALRTQQTVELLNCDLKTPIQLNHALYMATEFEVRGVLNGVDPEVSCVALTTHMPTIQRSATYFADEQSRAKLPSKYSTLCMLCFEISCLWEALDFGMASVVDTFLPRDFRDKQQTL